MCTGNCWVFRCRGCGGVLAKDHSLPGHTCHEAKRYRRRGLCRTGVEFAHYDKVANELCLMCELREEIGALTAETCPEGELEVLPDEEEDYEVVDEEVDVDEEEDVDEDEDVDDEEGGVSLKCDDEDGDEEDGGAEIASRWFVILLG
ncbi:hypothetical protein F5B20DRAFT_581569 [Whalleya microplaca]|nr:hypothetical protein F5B20DRAFT_581569 [Whalleya microplaca]